MIRLIFLLTTFFWASFTSPAQDYVFKILVNKGQNQFKKSEQANWQTVQTGLSLQNGDLIKVDNDAYLGLMHSSGRTKELVSPGTFEVEKLSSSLGKLKKGLASRYTEFVMQRFSDSKSRDELSQTGAVTRSTGQKIEVVLPTSSKVYDSLVVIALADEQSGQVYVLNTATMYNDPLVQMESTTGKFYLNLSDPDLLGEKMIFMNIAFKGEEQLRSVDLGLYRMEGEEAVEVKEELKLLAMEIEPETSLGQIILATYFEEKELLVDAIRCYDRAMEISPNVQEFEDLFWSFVARRKLLN